MKALQKLYYENFIKTLQKTLQRPYKKVACLHVFKKTCLLFNNTLHAFKIRLNEYFLNS